MEEKSGPRCPSGFSLREKPSDHILSVNTYVDHCGNYKVNLSIRWLSLPCEPVTSNLSVRKEVIQPQVPLRLPCYDLVPITEFTLGTCLPKVGPATLGAPRFRGLTGGVYKAQEHIHRSMLTCDY